MIIHPESHIERVGAFLAGRRVLEIGCGDGFRSRQLVQFCLHLVGVDPSSRAVESARLHNSHPQIDYDEASAEALPFGDSEFGAALFVLSLHHIPAGMMRQSISEAIRVVQKDAPIIFIEPGFRGSFFELDAALGACDGDERLQKAQAYAAILSHPELEEVEEFWDTTRYSLDSTQDFIDEFEIPQENHAAVGQWLTRTGHQLDGERRVNICRRRA